MSTCNQNWNKLLKFLICNLPLFADLLLGMFELKDRHVKLTKFGKYRFTFRAWLRNSII